MHKEEKDAILYHMYCIAVGDDEAKIFVEDKESLYAVDDCCYYVFTNVRGPIILKNSDIEFLNGKINDNFQPELLLNDEDTHKLNTLLAAYYKS